jgi:hypothetical protein
MAIAPLNKFLTIAVPVAPGEQVIYKTPTGVSAILLYAQVANVAAGSTYPTFTMKHRRLSKVGNTRDIRLIKDVEVPPNDAVIIIDGRLILEKSALISDSVVIEGSQVGVVTISNCLYDETTGISTITTLTDHLFNVGDEITMSGLEFSCTDSPGITTTIYPSPQVSFVVDEVTNSTTFVTTAGVGAGITHTYVGGGHVGPLQLEFTCSILENSTS